MNEILWPKIWGLLLVPPGLIVIVGLFGMFFMIWRRWVGGLIVVVSLFALFVFSLPLVGKRLMAQIEAPFRDAVIKTAKPGGEERAIVILGGGRYTGAPEYGDEDTVNHYTLERLRYGARLALQTGLPILVSGGPVYGEEMSEGALMQQVLERDFGTKVKWVEGKSRTTMENAEYTKLILSEAKIQRVYLVTHAGHMDRAQWVFVDAGVVVTPAPMGFTTVGKGDLTALGYLPSAGGLNASALALRERLGLYWYKRKRDAKAAADAVNEAQ